ncbi:DUF6155 family protein [Bacillus sp. 1NLA3E]|uniref:DUF6155 family protein n=1 Tax=Bacillus sp. 1NLA3E TaxID=666686 RepID=UPI000247E984|nr:DUF6155 family protein [Bacillus sp. 1NLA3E]
MKIKISELKRHLKEYDQTELIQLIVELSKINKDVQNYLSSKFLGDEAVEELFTFARKQIQNEFFPEKGHGKLRLSDAKKTIKTFEQTTGDKQRTVDLMLFYVELGVEFTNTYGDIDASFYTNVGNMYEKVVSICDDEEEYYHTFAGRLEKVVRDTVDVGWGFHDYFCDCYYSLQWLDDEEDEN